MEITPAGAVYSALQSGGGVILDTDSTGPSALEPSGTGPVLVRQALDGTPLWSVTMDGAGNAMRSSATDHGVTWTTMAIGPVTFTDTEGGVASYAEVAPNQNSYVASYDAQGALQWTARLRPDTTEPNSYVHLYAVMRLADDSVIIGATSVAPIVLEAGDGTVSTIDAPPHAGSFGWLARLSETGQLMWSHRLLGPERVFVWDFGAAEGSDDLTVLVGFHSGDDGLLVGEGQPGSYELAPSEEGYALFRQALDGSVHPLASGTLYGTGLGVGADGSLVVSGTYYGSPFPQLDSGRGRQMWTTGYDPAGIHRWSSFTSPASSEPAQAAPKEVRRTDDGAVVVALADNGTVLDVGGPSETLLDPSGYVTFIARHDGQGAIRCLVPLFQTNPTNYAIATGISPLPDGTWMLTGTFFGEVVLGEGDHQVTLRGPPAGADNALPPGFAVRIAL